MTVEELGQEVRSLTDAVRTRDYLAILEKIGTGYQAFGEFLAGFRQDVRGVEGGEPALSLATVDLGPLELKCGELIDACTAMHSEVHSQRETMRADPTGLGPMEIIAILQAAQKLAEILRNWRKRRQEIGV